MWDADGTYWSLAYVARLKDPTGQQIAHQTGGVYKPSISGQITTSAPLIEGDYRCEVEWYVEGSHIGTALDVYQSPGQVPTSLDMYYSNTTYPSGYRYYSVRDYQVRDQTAQAIQRVMFIDETMSTGENTCGVAFVEGDANSQSNGTFRDNLYMHGSVPACDNGGSCTAVKFQSFKADGNPLSPNYTLTYTCSGVSVQ